ncbi:MAG: hypothetical protein RIS94_460 [Pseudomonadota bacterium]|jgi:diguanylate cyclase (GGDEF)-like protein
MSVAHPGWARRLMAVFALIALAVLLPAGAMARTVQTVQVCHAAAPVGVPMAVLLQQRDGWHCDDSDWSIAGESLVLRFRIDPADAAPPRSFVTVASRFAVMDFAVVDARGGLSESRHVPADARHLPAGPMMVLPLPAVRGDAPMRTVMVRIERPWTKAIGSEARLDTTSDGTGWPIDEIVAMAVICGLLVVPLMLNAAFYSVLPERFVFWHLVVTGSMLMQVLVGTGFIHLIVPIPEVLEAPLNNCCYALMSSAAMMFAATFIEPGFMSRRLRKGLVRGAPVVFGVGAMTALPFEALRPYATLILHLDMIPALVLVIASAFDARARGSVHAWYQIGSWAPVMLLGGWKVVLYALPGQKPLEATVIYQLGLAIQVLVATMGIISRFLVLRRERDTATARARELEGIAGRDPLTGLGNRRLIEQSFETMFRKGYRTMAVIDLDHFKQVNDRYGHGVGDTVLKAVAGALSSDAGAFAVRMGGEEFLLLLRGRDGATRAEHCRRAIPARVAAEVPGLDRMVTASMGLVEHDPNGALNADFDALYRHCDRLLYEAKRLGRNRTMRERLMTFASEPAVAAG